MSATRALLLEFLISFKNGWASGMGGPVAAICALVGVCVDPGTAQIILFSVAALSLGVASYGVWSAEHQKVLLLEERLRPKLSLKLGKEEHFFDSPNTSLRRGRSLSVSNKGSTTLHRCQVRLAILTEDGQASPKLRQDVPISEEFTLSPRDTAKVGILFSSVDEKDSPLFIVPWERDPNGKFYPKITDLKKLEVGEHEVILKAFSEDCLPRAMRLKLTYKDDKWVFEHVTR